jgi:membrane dipeptidase
LPGALRGRFDEVDISQEQAGLHTDIPRLLAGNVGAQYWSVWVPASLDKTGGALHQTIEQIDLVYRMVERYPEVFEMAFGTDDIERIRREGKIACLIGAEGGHSMEASLGCLRMLYKLGVRYMTLTHADTLSWADSATDEPQSDGLSEFGEDVIREMNRLGMLIDISHVSPATMKDALRISQAPVIASHSSAYAVAQHARNVPDDVLALVAENRGVIMVNFFSGFVVPESALAMAEMFDARRELRAKHTDDEEFEQAFQEWRDAHPMEAGELSDVVDHIDHIAKVAGVDCVGLGSDYDGVGMLPEGLEDVSTYPAITQELLDRGYSEVDIKKILGGNALRALREAELVAQRMSAAH